MPSAFSTPPEKIADTVPGVNELIRHRWSPRAFSDRAISNEDLRIVLDAARWAASSYNEQPWRFLVARKSDAADFERILEVLMEANRAWAKFAPVLMIMAAKRTFSHSGAPNYYGLHDAGAALANLMLQAAALGMQAHGMAGFDRERARAELGIPDDFDLAAAVAVGYPGSPEQLPERYRKSEMAKRERKPLEEIVFSAAWEKPLPL